MTDYYKSSAEETLRELQTSPTGLTSRQAQARQEKYGINKLKEAEKPGFLKRFFLQLKDPMLLILLAAAAVSALTGMLSGESEWAGNDHHSGRRPAQRSPRRDPGAKGRSGDRGSAKHDGRHLQGPARWETVIRRLSTLSPAMSFCWKPATPSRPTGGSWKAPP